MMNGRIVVTEDSVLRMPRGVRLHFDKERDHWVVLAPERVFVLDQIALEIVKRCDGEASVAGIVDDLAATYDAPREAILEDVFGLLQDFTDKRVLTV
jgi:pyrroloquinoline quinone biosynthesis protein D